MNYDILNWRRYVLFLFPIFVLNACQSTEDVPVYGEVDKQQRTQLGVAVSNIIATDSMHYLVLPRSHPSYQSTYQYLQKLYNQAYFIMRDDWQSASGDRWDTSREWQIHILRSLEKKAFCVPGGDFYVTTALLHSLDFEYELYYIMTFEALLMHHRHLLKKLTAFAGSTWELLTLMDATPPNAAIDIASLTYFLTDELTFSETNLIREMDLLTQQYICGSSVLAPNGILSVLNKLDVSDAWLTTRPSYAERAGILMSATESSSLDCGNKKWINKQTDFKEYINVLP